MTKPNGSDRRIRTPQDLDALHFPRASGGEGGGEGGLLPVVAQEASTGAVLMLAWANREALERTLESGEMHYYSRSRAEIWHKGATSGNIQAVRSLHVDCDGDAILALVDPAGPACHSGEPTCFGREPGGGWDSRTGGGLADLWATLETRAADPPEDSYTARLLSDENLRLKKLGEETAELIHGLAKRDDERIPEEAADLVYHLLVALLAAGHSLEGVERALARRKR